MTLGKRRHLVLTVAAASGAATLAAVLMLSGDGGSDAAPVAIEPRDGLLDAPLRLTVDAVDGGVPLRLTMSATGADGVRWTGDLTYLPNGPGRVSVDGGRLLGALRPTGPRADARDVALIAPELELRLAARQGDRVIGTARASRRVSGPGVSATELTAGKDGVVGRLWTGPADGRRPVAVLLLGGSEGGLSGEPIAALLASHGYPVLQLAYFGVDGLPGELRRIPLEYFVAALELLRADGRAERVVVLGRSRGAELALILGSRFPELIDGVVAYAPSSVVNPALDCRPAWTFQGSPIPTVECSEYGFAAPTDEETIIAVERIDGPVMTVAGVSDMVWPAASYSAAIARRLERHRRADATELVFPDAGHGVVAAIPYLPLAIRNEDFAETRKADALARTAAWPRVLALLERVSKAE